MFNYDNQGHLTGTTISNSPNNEVSSTVIYNGNNISEIKFYKAGNILERDLTITYQNGNVINLLCTSNLNSSVGYAFQYDSSNHAIKEVLNDIVDGTTNTCVLSFTNFDENYNITQAVPFWEYFWFSAGSFFINYPPGVNNSISDSVSCTPGSSGLNTISYQYNIYGYPSTGTVSNGIIDNFQYILTN